MDSAFTCRTLPWGSRPSSCQGPVRFFVDFACRASLVDSGWSCVPVQGNLSANCPVVALLCCPLGIRRLRFNVLYHFRAHRVDSRWRTGHLQQSLCVRFSLRQDGKFTELVLMVQGQGRCMRREETISGRRVLFVSVWPVPGPLLALLSPSPHAHLRRAIHKWCSSCNAPDLSADHFKGVGRLPMWTSGKRVCAIGSAVNRLRTGSRARGRAACTPNVPQLHINSCSKTSACRQAAGEERL